jgi:ubiquinone/menaquinone biosynthesis C-methylase UbiE
MVVGTKERGPWRSMSHHRLYQEINESLVAALEIDDGDTVIDLGCGDGAISQILVDQLDDRVHIWAVDPDAEMLSDTRVQLGAHVGTCAATAESFGQLFPPGSCNSVVLANALHLVGDRDALYGNLRRVLTPGGVFAFNTTFYLSDLLRPSSAYVMEIGFAARSVARRRGLKVPPFTRTSEDAHLARTLPAPDDLADELRAASLEVIHVEERPWTLDNGFMSSFMSAPYEATILLPNLDVYEAADIIREASDKVAAKKRDPVPRPWLTMVARLLP